MAYTSINDSSAQFQVQLYTGNQSTKNVVNGGNSNLQPDWVWIKARNATRDHRLMDSTRGVQKELVSNGTAAEYTEATGFTAFQSDGFQHGGANGYGASGETYVSWQWKANGGTTTTNDASSTSVGTIDSVYQANTTAGFSIVTYTGTGSAGTIAHGLGVAPTLIIGKDRSDTSQWFVQHPAFGATHYGELDDTTAFADDANYFNDSTPTSTVFGIGSDGATGGTTNYVAYCFAPIQGYSKFGKYTGNGNADGPFVYTGFKPAWLMIKETISGGGWGMWDNKRTPTNPMKIRLLANTSAADDTSNDNSVDFLSNGFKMRTSSGSFNQNSTNILYMAFAEHPFVSSKGVPTTAR